ncbi:MAG: TIGR03936 family radical SAM-associated protein [Planctomycetota bacterium]|nr:TIGR03936 family radical SAM-associated protein [Planctomycetota bacterium]
MPNRLADGSSIRGKVEIRFEKRPEVRFLSHLEIARAFGRALRRACIPVRFTQGFNPRPRLVFPAPIEVGVASLDDVAELELAGEMSPDEIASRLRGNLPPGLGVHRVAPIPCRRRPGKLRELRYAMDFSRARWKISKEYVEAFLNADKVHVLRRAPAGGKPRLVDARPAAVEVRLDGTTILLRLRPLPGAFVRADEVLAGIAGRKVDETIGVSIVRLRVEMESCAPENGSGRVMDETAGGAPTGAAPIGEAGHPAGRKDGPRA